MQDGNGYKGLDYNYTEEGDILAAYGFEGKTFEYGPDGKPVFTPFVYNNRMDSLQEMYLKYAKLGAPVYIIGKRIAGLRNSLDAVQIWQKNNDGIYCLYYNDIR